VMKNEQENGDSTASAGLAATASGAWRARFDLMATIAMLGVAGFLIWRSVSPVQGARAEVKPPALPVRIDQATFLGARETGVAMVMYSDFECPFCRKFAHEVLPAVMKDYVTPGKVLLGFRHLPLGIHKNASGAAQAAVCAERQGRFWEMHDALLADPLALAPPDVVDKASVLRLDAAAFEACVKEPLSPRIQLDVDSAKALGITGTPAFLVGKINGRGELQVSTMLMGARPLKDFAAALDAALASR
jgi:protein-disulfide isomerase